MNRRAWTATISTACMLCAASQLSAQVLQRLEPCPPDPALADEINAKKAQTPHPKIIIEVVKLDSATEIPRPIQEQLLASLKGRQLDADSKWVQDIQEEVRGIWQDEGYFKAEVQIETQLIAFDSINQRVSLLIRMEPGRQYRLAEMRFRNSDPDRALAVEPEELRKLIPLQNGEIFNVQKIREGLDALRVFYGSKGYIDFTATPLTDIDEENQRISLTFELDEQLLFRIESIVVLGLDPGKASLLKWQVKPGDSYNTALFEAFFEDNKALLPADASPADVNIHRDLRRGTVSLTLDFRDCQNQ